MKHPDEITTKWHWLVIGVFASIALHGLLLLLPGWRASSPKQLNTIEISMAPHSPAVAREMPDREPDPEPEPEPIAQDLPDDPEPIEQTTPAVATAETSEPDASQDAEPETPSSGIELRERVLAVIAHDQAGPASGGARNILERAAPPRLPDSPGWLNDYVGTVQPQVDRWQGNDGSQNTRIVMASGQVICGRADPPSSAEMFNPSMAMNIMRFKPCGRERPPPVDRSDPWLRAPGE